MHVKEIKYMFKKMKTYTACSTGDVSFGIRTSSTQYLSIIQTFIHLRYLKKIYYLV